VWEAFTFLPIMPRENEEPLYKRIYLVSSYFLKINEQAETLC